MITIAIPVYNREKLVKRMATSLYLSDLCVPYNICIYDDNSSDFDINTLKTLSPNAKKIVRHPNNMGADANIYYMYCDFLKSEDEYFFNGDSDLIFSKMWMRESLKLILKTEGVLSLFNTKTHPKLSDIDEELCLKRTVGAAGMLLTREHVKEIVMKFRNEDKMSFDWKVCDFFKRRKINIYCVNNSLVQHIGFESLNSRKCFFDYGENFIVDTIENGKILNDSLGEYISYSQKECKNRCNAYKIGYMFLVPIKLMKNIYSKIKQFV